MHLDSSQNASCGNVIHSLTNMQCKWYLFLCSKTF